MVITIGDNITNATVEHQTVIDTVTKYAGESHYGADHVDRWNRVLAGFGDATKHTNPMTAQEAQVNTYLFNPDRWQPVAIALASVQNTLIDKEAALVTAATQWSQETKHGTTHVERWERVLAALDVAGYEDKMPMTIDEAQKFADKGWKRWMHVLDVLSTLETDTSTDNGGDSTQQQPATEIIIRPGFINNLKTYVSETYHGADHVKRWERVLYTFGIDGYTADSKMTAQEAQKLADKGWKRWIPVTQALTDLEREGMLRDVSIPLVTHDSLTVQWWEPYIQRNYTITVKEHASNTIIANQTVLTGASLGVSSYTVTGLAPETDYTVLVKVSDLNQTTFPIIRTTAAPEIQDSPQQTDPQDSPQQTDLLLPGNTPMPQQSDNTPPVIHLNGAARILIDQNSTFTDPATCNDAVDGTRTLTITGDTVDTAVLGTYVINYDCQDSSNNAAMQLSRTVIVVTPGDSFEIVLSSDDEESSPVGTIKEGGHVWFRLYTDTEPTEEIQVEFEARMSVKAYKDSSGGAWSAWGPVGNIVESGSRSTNDKGMALKDLYTNDTNDCCVKDGYWFQEGSKWYTTHTLVSHDDNYIGQAERHYEFRIADVPAQKFKAIVKEDDSYSGGAHPDWIRMVRTDGGKSEDTGSLTFNLGRSHFDGYDIKLTGTGAAARGTISSWTINVGADHEPSGSIILDRGFGACIGDGAGWVDAELVLSSGLTSLTPIKPDRLQICY